MSTAVHAGHSDQIWMADVTFIPTRQGWLYLAVLIDLFSRLIVGWATKDRPNRELVNEALLMAVEQRAPKPGLIHHSDQGILYAARKYLELLKRSGMIRSMSGEGNCYDNAVVESSFSSLKNELTHHREYQTSGADRNIRVHRAVLGSAALNNRERVSKTRHIVFETVAIPKRCRQDHSK
jgi:transposase InsO family protein